MSPPERAQIIARTFERDGFPALLREMRRDVQEERIRSRRPPGATRRPATQDEALALLEACSLRRCSDLVNLIVEPDFDVLRADPRFQQLLRQVGLR